ncbi:hypothetical protein [Acinetobacter modestus]|uniref:hypothetical protein n=1 Tax=Acinetobacter modestus TaxID=1776740 RepID=UPI00301757CB
MDNIKVGYIAKTVYDNKEELVKNRKEQRTDLFDPSFLNTIKEQTTSNIEMDKNTYLRADVHQSNSKTINYEKSYDLKSTAINHLSYLNEISNFQLPHQMASIEYSRSSLSMQKDVIENPMVDKKTVEKSIQLVEFFHQQGFRVEISPNNKAFIEPTKILGESPHFFKKNILITKSELFIRSSQEDHVELLENIQRQLPSSIDRIWMNGKMIWSKI